MPETRAHGATGGKDGITGATPGTRLLETTLALACVGILALALIGRWL